MLYKWTDEFINSALSDLTEKELAALHCSLEIPKSSKRPGAKRLAKFGLVDVDEYQNNLEAAKRKTLDFFKRRGVKHVYDLDFDQPGKSVDHRKPRNVRSTGA